jgi:hypothetical protein
MHDAELKRMRESIRTREYVMTSHAEEEMDADGLTIYDVEHVILTGRVTERQKDQASGEWKHLVTGDALQGAAVTVVTKFGRTCNLIIITVFRE